MPNPKGHQDSIKNSQFKAAWQSGSTRTIRVPIALADATLEYARQLDNNIEPRDTANLLVNEMSNAKIEPRDTINLGAEVEALQQELRSQLIAVQAEREDLAQFKKEAKEAAAEVHREGMAIKQLETQWQQRLTDVRGELADAKAIILKQNDKIRELKRGFSLKPSPADAATMKAQRLEIGNLRSELADLKQKSAPIAIAVEFPEPAMILSQLRARRKKSKADLADIEAVLELLDKV